MARKIRGFERLLDAPALFAVAYGELASSIYFALGIVALYALGLTPAVLLLTGLLFLVVSLSYAEGTAAIPEAVRSSGTSASIGNSATSSPARSDRSAGGALPESRLRKCSSSSSRNSW